MRLAILASGNGTNAQAIAEAVRDGRLTAEIAVIVTNRPQAGVIEKARAFGLPVEILPSKGIKDREAYDRSLLNLLTPYRVDTIALAGWMRILSDVLIDAYPGRILNLHPAILPSFTGATGIEDACRYGVKLTGCTVHSVTRELDGGPIIIQAAVPVADSVEATEALIHRLEHLIFPQALQWLAEDRLKPDGRRLLLQPAADGRPRPQTAVIDGCLVSPPLEF